MPHTLMADGEGGKRLVMADGEGGKRLVYTPK